MAKTKKLKTFDFETKNGEGIITAKGDVSALNATKAEKEITDWFARKFGHLPGLLSVSEREEPDG